MGKNMKRNKYILLIGLTILSAIILFTIINQTQKKEFESIQYVSDINTENLTLLEKMCVDVDNDGQDESIELFTSAKRDDSGKMGWDDGQRWLLLVHDMEKKFLFFDDYVQNGQLEFWVCAINKFEKSPPLNTDLEKHIYVVQTGNGFQLSEYSWDKQNLCYQKEIIFNPTNQWEVLSSYKY